MFAVTSSSLHAFQLFSQRIDEEAADSPHRDVVALRRECDNLLQVGLPQFVVSDAPIKLYSIVMMERSTIDCVQLLKGSFAQFLPGVRRLLP